MWVRLDDGMALHPKFVRSGPEAMAFFVAGLCYCNRYRTDGLIPKLVLPSLLPGLSEHRAIELALRLATNALRPSWIDVGDHYRVHDYEVYQPTRDGVRDDAQRAQDAAPEQRGWGDVTREVTGYVTRDSDADEGVTRHRNAAERYGNAPLPGPLPPSRPDPVKRGDSTLSTSTGSGWNGDRERAKRAQNAARQRRFRARHAVPGVGVTRDVMRYVTRYGNGNGSVTRFGDAPVVDPDAGRCLSPSRGESSTVLSGGERERVRRARNAERQRRFRRRQATRRAEAEAASHGTQDRKEEAGHAPGVSGGEEGVLRTATGRSERDRRAEFVVWFPCYPRQEAEIRALQAWMAEPELPPLALMLERLTAQKVAKPDAYYWPAPDRYVREKRWRDQPPPGPGRAVQDRSVWARLRAMGSDEGRRQRLREISVAARFDPFGPGGSRG
jgi:hypothetical protein